MDQPGYTCPQCGAPITVGQERCAQCGLALDAASVAAFQRDHPAPFAGDRVPPPPLVYGGAGGPPLYGGPPGAPAPRSARRWVLGVLGVLILVCGVCGVLTTIGGVQLFQDMGQESAATQAVLDQFMQAGVRDDSRAAYALFTTAAGSSVTANDLATLFRTHRAYFDGYRTIHQQSYNFFSGTSGTTATISGAVSYSGRADVPFTARLVQENKHWKLVSMQFAEGVGQ
ncbi:MAG TPA: hypothetical protein VKY74_17150 [Chloroflexia bacterium]|nr:hypothetical protein [Chloroflexia bacterium]